MVEVKVESGLWILLLGTLTFLLTFALLIFMVPPETQTNLMTYEEYSTGRDRLSYSEMNMYASYDNFTAQFPASLMAINKYNKQYGEALLSFFFEKNSGGQNLLRIAHIEFGAWGLDITFHGLNLEDGTGEVYRSHVEKRLQKNDTNAILLFSCDHVSLKIVLSTPSNSTILYAWDNNLEMRVSVAYEVDFSKMSGSAWNTIAGILSFRAIKTGNTIIDVILNALVSIPVWISLGYIAYRLITGLIPTLSGGGGA